MKRLKKLKPVTPSQRHTLLINRSLTKPKNRLKSQTFGFKRSKGRNNQGRITVYTKGGGHKKVYRQLLLDRTKLKGIVEEIEYDPFRNANIARIFSYEDKKHYYILAPEELERGHQISSSILTPNLEFRIGNCYKIDELPLGSIVYDIRFPNSNKSFAKAAGCFALLLAKNDKFARLSLSSGEHRLVSNESRAFLGKVSNLEHRFMRLGKAGRNRWLGRRPSVRGVAMNPIDHPHGGGEGKTSGGRPSVTPWGKITRGKPTRKKKRNIYIVKKR